MDKWNLSFNFTFIERRYYYDKGLHKNHLNFNSNENQFYHYWDL